MVYARRKFDKIKNSLDLVITNVQLLNLRF